MSTHLEQQNLCLQLVDLAQKKKKTKNKDKLDWQYGYKHQTKKRLIRKNKSYKDKRNEGVEQTTKGTEKIINNL